jgi:hypothetical protein
MPTSDLNEEFTFNFIITDKAGNTLNIPPQRFLFDDQMGEYTPFAVHDSRVSTSVVPGISSGYVPFVRGLSVLENPYRMVIRIPELTGSHTVTAASPFLTIMAALRLFQKTRPMCT